MKNIISLIKINKNEIPCKTCLIPIDEIDIENYKLLSVGQIIHCEIKSNRKYSTHKYLFKMILFAKNNGIGEKDCKIHDSGLILKKNVITSILVESGNDYIKCWLRILKTLFLPLEEKTLISGEKIKVENSINYNKIDEVSFKEFIKQVEWFFSDSLQMELDKFKMEVNNV